MPASQQRSIPHRGYFTVVSLGYILVVVLMTIVMIAGRPDGSVVLVQLGQLADRSSVYQLACVLATLMPVFALLLIGGAGLLIPPASGVVTRLARLEGFVGALFLLAAMGFSGFAYVSQYTILPGRLTENFQKAEHWYILSSGSLPLSLDLIGAALFGVGAVLIAARLFGHHGALGWATWALCAAGAVGIVAWLLHLADSTRGGAFSLVGNGLVVLFALGMLVAAQEGADEDEAADDAADDEDGAVADDAADDARSVAPSGSPSDAV